MSTRKYSSPDTYVTESQRRVRRIFSRLEYHRAASCQGWRRLACNHGVGEIPLRQRRHVKQIPPDGPNVKPTSTTKNLHGKKLQQRRQHFPQQVTVFGRGGGIRGMDHKDCFGPHPGMISNNEYLVPDTEKKSWNAKAPSHGTGHTRLCVDSMCRHS